MQMKKGSTSLCLCERLKRKECVPHRQKILLLFFFFLNAKCCHHSNRQQLRCAKIVCVRWWRSFISVHTTLYFVELLSCQAGTHTHTPSEKKSVVLQVYWLQQLSLTHTWQCAFTSNRCICYSLCVCGCSVCVLVRMDSCQVKRDSAWQHQFYVLICSLDQDRIDRLREQATKIVRSYTCYMAHYTSNYEGQKDFNK